MIVMGNGVAVVLLVLVGVATLFALLSVILGLAAIIRINNSNGQLRGRGLAACALVLGLLWMMGLPLLFLVGGMTPSTVNSRMVVPMPAGTPVVIPPPANPIMVAPTPPRTRRRVQIGPAAETEKDTDVIEPVEYGTVKVEAATTPAPKASDPAPVPDPKAASQEF
jgi:hypothetical protein